MEPTTKIVYIEASTGNRWKLPEFPSRVNDDRFEIAFFAEYAFDKSDVVAQVLRPDREKPAAVVLQECAVYFPGPTADYKTLYRGWVDQIRAAGIRPVIATVVPPARANGIGRMAKDFVKVGILGRPSRYDQIREFNDWLRALAAERQLPVLDLERALRVSDADRHLRPEYDAGDGIHLNQPAYAELDRLLLRTLQSIDWTR